MYILNKLDERYLIKPKLMQLIVNLQYYTLHQIRFLFATKKFGISIGEYGEYNAYIVCFTFFTNLIIGSYCDRIGQQKNFLTAFIVLSILSLALFYIPAVENAKSSMFFWLLLLVYQVINMPKQPLMDKMILEYLRENTANAVESYGEQRTFGTIAYSVATFTIETLIKKFKGTKEIYLWKNLLYYSIAFGLASLVIINYGKTSKSVRYFGKTKGFIILLSNKEYSFFLFILFLNAITRNAMSAYLSNFYVHVLQIKPYTISERIPFLFRVILDFFNKNYISTITICGTMFEIITMYFSKNIISRFGYFLPLFVAQIISMLRFVAYFAVSRSFRHGYLYTCMIELLKGIYFGLMHITGFAIITKLTPPELIATSQMLFQGTFLALGALSSGFLFGRVFDKVLKDKSATVDQLHEAFKKLFKINIYFSLLIIAIFFIKYQIVEGVIFNKKNEELKLEDLKNEIKSVDINQISSSIV